MKKNLKVLLGAAVIAMVVTACSGSDTGSETVKAPVKKAEEKKGVVLKIALWGAAGEEKALKEAAKGLEEAVEGIDSVVWEQYPSVEEFYDTLPTETAIGKIPDIVILNNEEQKTLIEAGMLEAFDEIPDSGQYVGNVLEEWIYKDKLYGIPTSAAPALFIVNEDMWKAAGLTDCPETWEQVYEDAKVLRENGYMPLCIDIGNVYHVTQYLLAFGGGWNQGIDMNTEQNKEAVAYILKMFDEGLAVTALEEGKSWDGEVFNAGKCVMSTGGTWYIGAMKDTPEIHYRMIQMPCTENSSKKALHSYGISVMSSAGNKEAAKKAAAYLAREEAQAVRMKITGDCPSLLSLQDAYFEQYPDLAFMREDLSDTVGFDYPVDLSILDKVQEKLEQRIYGKEPQLTPDDILTP